MTRQQAIEIVKAGMSPDDMEEIEVRIESHADNMQAEIDEYGSTECEPADVLDAFVELTEDTEQVACSMAGDFYSRDDIRQARAFMLRANRVLVNLGMYRPISEDDAREAVRCGLGVRMSHFPVIDGQRYECETCYSAVAQIGREQEAN